MATGNLKPSNSASLNLAKFHPEITPVLLNRFLTRQQEIARQKTSDKQIFKAGKSEN